MVLRGVLYFGKTVSTCFSEPSQLTNSSGSKSTVSSWVEMLLRTVRSLGEWKWSSFVKEKECGVPTGTD